MSEQKGPGRPPYPAEFRERATWMVFEHQGAYATQWVAIESIAKKLQVNYETLRRVENDAGARPGLTTDQRVKVRELEREVRELRRANGS